MTITSLFNWPESTLILHANHMVNVDNKKIWKNKLNSKNQLLKPYHTELIIPYYHNYYWILIQVDFFALQIRYYNSLKRYIQGNRHIHFVQKKLQRLSISDTFSPNYSEEVWKTKILLLYQLMLYNYYYNNQIKQTVEFTSQKIQNN